MLNLLSLTAVYGAMVWVFQDGNLAGVPGFTPTAMIDTSMPVLLFCIAFGLSMDYEVFLLSRIKEEHDRTGDTVAAVVAVGLERTGPLLSPRRPAGDRVRRLCHLAGQLPQAVRDRHRPGHPGVDATLIRPCWCRRSCAWPVRPIRGRQRRRRLHALAGLAETPEPSGA